MVSPKNSTQDVKTSLLSTSSPKLNSQVLTLDHLPLKEMTSRSNVSRSTTKINSRKATVARLRSYDRTVLAFKNAETAKSHIKDSLKKYSTILFLLGFLAALFAMLDTQMTSMRRKMERELALSNRTETPKNPGKIQLLRGIEISSKAIISVLSLATGGSLYLFYTNLFNLGVIKHNYPCGTTFFGTVLVYRYLAELVVCLLHVPPGFESFKLPPESQLIVFLRLYLLVRFVKEKHKLVNSKSTRFLASVTKTELSSMFLIKTYFMRNPFFLIISSYLTTIIIGGYAVYMVEGSYTYMDTIWMLVVTMTTVGFGDYVPKTLFGRALVGFAAVLGIFLMALFISLVHESLQLSQQEKRILAYIDCTDMNRGKKEMAALAIQAWWKYCHYIDRLHHSETINILQWVKFRHLRSKLYAVMEKWRILRQPQEDHWRKEFQMDNTAMMLTDVARKVKFIEEYIRTLTGSEDDADDPPDSNVNLSKMVSREVDIVVTKGSPSLHPNGIRKALPPSLSDKGIDLPVSKSESISLAHDLLQLDEVEETTFHEKRDKPISITISEPAVVGKVACRDKFGFPVSSQAPKSRSLEKLGRKDMDKTDMVLELLHNQVRSMRSRLDSMHARTRQDLQDLENIVLSMLNQDCLDGKALEENSKKLPDMPSSVC